MLLAIFLHAVIMVILFDARDNNGTDCAESEKHEILIISSDHLPVLAISLCFLLPWWVTVQA